MLPSHSQIMRGERRVTTCVDIYIQSENLNTSRNKHSAELRQQITQGEDSIPWTLLS